MAHRRTRRARGIAAAPRATAVSSTLATSGASQKALLPLGTLMLAASVSSWAQSGAPATTAATGTLAPVTVTDKAEQQGKDSVQTRQTNIGKGTQDIRDIPQSINVITEKLIDDVKLETLRQALHYTSGITFAATENGTDQDIRMRGFPVATTGDLLIDGMRDPSQYDRDTFNYDRIEVMRGSASMIFGRGSTGGVINQVNKQPMLLDQYELEASVGSHGLFRTTADLNKQIGDDAALRINLMYNKADNGGASIDKYGIAPTYRWGIGTRDEFSVGLFHLNVDNVPRAAIRYLNGTGPTDALDPSKFYGSPSDYLLGKADYVNGSWLRRLDGGGTVKTQFRVGTFDRTQWTTVNGYGTTNGATTTLANIGPSTILTRSGLAPRKDQYDGAYLQSDYNDKFNWFGVQHAVLAGVDLSREQAKRYTAYNGPGTNYNKGNTSLGTPDDGVYAAATPNFRQSSDYTGTALGIYAQDLVQIAPAWKLLAGVRLDNFDVKTGGMYTYAGATSPTVTGSTRTELSYSGLFSYRLGALYQPTPTQSYHLSYGTSFTSAADTYQYTTAQNANTPAEKSRNIELGAKLDWLDGNLSTRGALFRSDKYNERTTDSDFAGTAYLLSGRRHSTGLELDVVGKLSAQWEVYLSYTYINSAKIDRVARTASQTLIGQRVGLTPEHSISAWLSYQATPKLRVAGGVRAVGQNHPLQGTSGAAMLTVKAPGYAVADAMVEYKISEDLTAQLNVSNIANRTYGDQLYPGFVMLGDPRTFKATLTKKF